MRTHQDRVYRYLTNWTHQCIRSHCRIHIKRLIIVIEPTRELPFMAVYCVILMGVQSILHIRPLPNENTINSTKAQTLADMGCDFTYSYCDCFTPGVAAAASHSH